MTALHDLQKSVCRKFGANFDAYDESLRVGINRDFDPRHIPINGLRHPPESNMTGWFIWSTETFSEADDFLMRCARTIT